MAKKLNKNLVITLSILGFVITTAAGVLMVATLQSKDPQDLANKAQQCVEQQDWQNAAIYYQRAYAVSQNPQYLVDAGEALYNIDGKEMEAGSLYHKAVVLDNTLVEAHSKLLDINLEIARLFGGIATFEEIQKTAEEMLKLDIKDPATRAKAIYAQGVSLLAFKAQSPDNEAKGTELLAQAIEIAPENVKYTSHLCELKMKDADLLENDASRSTRPEESIRLRNEASKLREEAESLCRNLVEHNPGEGLDPVEARCLYANYYMRMKEYEKAEQFYKQAQQLTSGDPDATEKALFGFASYWLTRWHTDRAEDDAETRHQKRDKAIALLQEIIDAKPQGFLAYRALADIYLFINQPDKAEQVCQKRLDLAFQREGLSSAESRSHRYYLLLKLAEAKLRQARQEPAGSEKRLALAGDAEMNVSEALSENNQGADAYNLRGQINFALNKDREAIQAFEEAEKLYPIPNIQNKYMLALAYFREQQFGAARQAALEAVALPNAGPQVWITYADILFRLGESDKSLEAAKHTLRLDPNNLRAKLLVTSIQRKMGHAPEEVVDTTGARPELVSVAARQMAFDGKIDEALASIDEALVEHPNNWPLIKAAVDICNNNERKGEASSRLAKALAEDPENLQLKIQKIAIEAESQEQYLEQFLQLAQTVEDEYHKALLLVDYYRTTDNKAEYKKQLNIAKRLLLEQSTEEARQAGESALRSTVDQLITLAAMDKNFHEIDELVALATEKNLDAAQGMSYRGRALLAQGKFDEAIDALQQAVELYPTSGQTLAELGEAYFLAEQYNESRIAFQRSHEAQPRNGSVIKRLALLAERAGDQKQLAEMIEKCQRLIPDDPWVIAKALELKEEDNPAEGIARREELRAKTPEDVHNLFRLALLYHQVGNWEKAVQCAQQMWQQRPDKAVAERVAAILRQCNKPNMALEILSELVRNADGIDQKAEAQLLIGGHYTELGSLDQAEREYLAAADIKATEQVCKAIGQFQFFNQKYRSAYDWFEKAGKIAADNNSPEITSIEQRAIEALIRDGDLSSAKAKCDSYLSKYKNDAAGILLDSEISASQGDIEEAIQRLTEVIEMEPRRVAALHQRARYRASLGDWQRALSDWEQIKVIEPTAFNFVPRIKMAQAMARMGQNDQAINELVSVHEEYPDADNVTAALISQYMHQERFTDAGTLVTSLLNQDPENVRWLAASGEIAMKQENRTKAIADLQKAVVLGKFDSYLTVKLLSAFEHFKMAEQGISFFEKSVPPDRRPPSVIVAYANLLAMRGDTEAAIYNYRSALHVSRYSSAEFLFGLIVEIGKSLGREEAFSLFEQTKPDEILARADKHIRAALLQGTGKFKEALQLDQSLLGSTENPTERALLLTCMAMLYEKLDDFNKAKDLYEQSLAINDRSVFALNNLAFILSDKLGQPKSAIPYAKRAVAVDDSPTIRDTLGWTYVQAGMLRDAIAELSLARRDNPSLIPAAYHLGEAYRRDGRFQRAATLFREVLETPLNDDPFAKEYIALAEEGLRKANENSTD